jgi:HEAT repeat protein
MEGRRMSSSEVSRAVGRLRSLVEGPAAFFEVLSLGEAAVPALRALLLGPTESVPQPRCLAADALAALGGDDVEQTLVDALWDSAMRRLDPVLRGAEDVVLNRIALHLGSARSPRASETLLAILRARPLAGCARALGRLHDPRALPLLARCLLDDFAREAAEEALRAFGQSAVPHLTRILLRPCAEHDLEGSSGRRGRAAAATLLGEIGGPATPLPLAWALFDSALEVRVACALALGSWGAEEALVVGPFVAQVAHEVDWPDLERLGALLRGLGPPAVFLVRPMLRQGTVGESGRRLKLWALSLVAEVGGDEALEALRAVADDPDAQVRYAAVGALGGRVGSVSALEGFAGDPEPMVRRRVVAELRVCGRQAIPTLRQLNKDRDPKTRQAARAALEELAGRR